MSNPVFQLHVERHPDPEAISVVTAVNNLPYGTWTDVRSEHAPNAFVDLLATHRIRHIESTPQAVTFWRHDPQDDWGTLAPLCREAVIAALSDPVVMESTRSLVEFGIGRLAQSHGGGIEIEEITADEVAVRLHGACKGCPAATNTLHRGLRSDLDRAGLANRSIRVIS